MEVTEQTEENVIGQKSVTKVLLGKTTQTKQLTKTKMFALIGSQTNASLDRTYGLGKM